MSELADKIQQHITIDDSGNDNDTIEIAGARGPVTVQFTRGFYDGVDAGIITLPDGTNFDSDTLQLAFEQALIAKTGKCVLETEYGRIARKERGV